MKEKILGELLKNGIIINKNNPTRNYLNIAQQIMIKDVYEKKPYLNTTQNEQYMRSLMQENIQNAFVVMGAGDPIFQLLAHDVLNIDAVDINEMQKAVFALKKASIKTLNNSEYESFLLDRNSINFLSKDIFNEVKNGFDESETIEKDFWKLFLKSSDINEVKQFFFKGGIECHSIDISRKSILFTKKKFLYNKIKGNLEKAKIVIKTQDALEFLIRDLNKVYDYIDITNILLFMYQMKDNKEFSNYIQKIKFVYDNRLNNNGIFVLDYMFGINGCELNKGDNLNLQAKIYQELFKHLAEYFNIQILNVEAIKNATSLNGSLDTVIYTKKK